MRKKYILMIIGIILLWILIFAFIYFLIRREQTIPTISLSPIEEETEKSIVIFPNIEWKVADINQYTVYGTHLNLSITLEEELVDIKEAKLMPLTIEPILAYMYAKRTESKNLRIIFTGKLNNISSGKIKERLRESYV